MSANENPVSGAVPSDVTLHAFSSERIRPRRLRLDAAATPLHWIPGRPFLAHFLNALHLLFPPGERWFVLACRAALPRISDAGLRERVRGFIAQESNHGATHDRFLAPLRDAGFAVERWAGRLERLFEHLRLRVPFRLQLAIIAGVELYTTALSAALLERDVLRGADPLGRRLFYWHAAEEIEHRSVAHDLLEDVAPGAVLRTLGLLLATAGLLLSWGVLCSALALGDRSVSRRELAADALHSLRNGDLGVGDCVRAFFLYLRPSFHPAVAYDETRARSLIAEL